MKHFNGILTALSAAASLLLLPVVASAAEPAAPPVATVAIKLGGAFPGLFSELDSSGQVLLEAGAFFLDGRADADLVFGYAQPTATSDGTDARLGDGAYAWDLKHDLVTVGIVGRYRFSPWSGPVQLYAHLSPRLYLMKTTVNGESGGSKLGENIQYDREFGVEVGGGAEWAVGPGAALAELNLNLGGLEGQITGDVPSSAGGLLVGYRLNF